MMIQYLLLFGTLKIIAPRVLLAAAIAGILYVIIQSSKSTTSAITATTTDPLDFLVKFDPSRYKEIQEKRKEFNKLYQYILGERRPCHPGIDDLRLLQTETLDLLDSVMLVIPSEFKHIYGRKPDEDLQKAIQDYTNDTDQKLRTLKRFCNATATTASQR